MDASLAVVAGVLIAVAAFALKAGGGCGLASLRRGEVVVVLLMYILASLAAGAVMERISEEKLYTLLNLGVASHAALSLALIFFGIKTIKDHTSGCDVSRKTFLAMALPCPACITALFFSAGMLMEYTQASGLRIGAELGIFFFSVALASAMGLRRYASPRNLGAAMVMLGLLYLCALLLVPAYLKLRHLRFSSIAPPLEDVLKAYVLFAALIAAGFLKAKVVR